MEPEAKYTLVGTVVVILVTILAVVIVWLRSSGEGAGAQRYTIYFEQQTLQGLQVRGDVTMRGIKVGSIGSLSFSQRRPGAVEVVIAVDAHTPVRESTGAVVERNLLTGLATLQLVNTTEDTPLLTKPPAGERYPVIGEGQSRMQQMTQSLDQLGAHADVTMQSINATLSPQNREAFAEILDNLRRVSRHADATLGRADVALTSVARASDEMRGLALSLGDDARVLSARYDAVGAQAISTFGEADATLRQIREDADRVSRRADEVLVTTADEVRDTTRALRWAADSVGSTASRLHNPQRAIFGPADAALGPGESSQ